MELENVIDQGLEYSYGDKDIFGITCGIFDAIGSIMIDFSDKSTTPMFGTEQGHQMKCKLEVPNQEKIVSIRIRHKVKTASIQNITFITDLGSEIEFNGQLEDGEWEQFDL